MTKDYQIETLDLKIEDVISQIKAIKQFPCMVHIYDRVFRIENALEAWALNQGLEVGYYLGH